MLYVLFTHFLRHLTDVVIFEYPKKRVQNACLRSYLTYLIRLQTQQHILYSVYLQIENGCSNSDN